MIDMAGLHTQVQRDMDAQSVHLSIITMSHAYFMQLHFLCVEVRVLRSKSLVLRESVCASSGTTKWIVLIVKRSTLVVMKEK